MNNNDANTSKNNTPPTGSKLKSKNKKDKSKKSKCCWIIDNKMNITWFKSTYIGHISVILVIN